MRITAQLGLVIACCLPGLTLACVGRASAAVIISEIMFNPQGTDLDTTVTPNIQREWVELYNTGPDSVSLASWQFGDSADNDWSTPFPAGTSLAANQALVITGDAATFDGNWGGGINRLQVGGFPVLANTAGNNEAAAIRNNLGVIQDIARFQDNAWPTANGSDGNSVFLLPGAFTTTANDVAANWKPSSAGAYSARWTNAAGLGENHGSPGVVNTTLQQPFAPTPGARWSIVHFPDTQNYAKDTANLPIFSQMTNWVKDNRDLYNIKLVVQSGDLVNNNDTENPTSGNQTGDQQWANARAAMSILDGYVPYIIAPGNHDLGTTSAQNRDTQMNTYFQPSQNPLIDPAQGGILKGLFQPGHLENAYFEVRGEDGRNLLIFALEFWPRQAVVAWANQIADLPQYRDHTAAIVTHSYLNWNNQLLNNDGSSYGVGAGGDFNDGLQLWNELVKVNENFEMTFSGHVGGDGVGYLEGTGTDGNTVHQMLLNAQFETNGGNGWFRLVEFLDDGTTARVRTFSPFLGYARTNAANDYLIDLTQLTYQPEDFDKNGVINGDDLAVWQTNLGQSSGATQSLGDADADGDVDGRDFLRWQLAAAVSAASPSQTVPEPAGLLLAALATALIWAGHVRRTNRTLARAG